jgi:hypothetical protein
MEPLFAGAVVAAVILIWWVTSCAQSHLEDQLAGFWGELGGGNALLIAPGLGGANLEGDAGVSVSKGASVGLTSAIAYAFGAGSVEVDFASGLHVDDVDVVSALLEPKAARLTLRRANGEDLLTLYRDGGATKQAFESLAADGAGLGDI